MGDNVLNKHAPKSCGNMRDFFFQLHANCRVLHRKTQENWTKINPINSGPDSEFRYPVRDS